MRRTNDPFDEMFVNMDNHINATSRDMDRLGEDISIKDNQLDMGHNRMVHRANRRMEEINRGTHNSFFCNERSAINNPDSNWWEDNPFG